MQLPLTSLVPSIIEITTFISQNWPHIWWFPNWYLGVPLRFITGPIIPLLLLILRSITHISLTQLYIGILLVAELGGAVGLVVLNRSLGAGKVKTRLSTIYFLLLPLQLILFVFGNGLNHLAIALLPWVLLSWNRFLQQQKKVWAFVSSGLIAISLLLSISSLLPIIIGVVILWFINSQLHQREVNLVTALIMSATGLSLSTIWYTPRFWLILLGNPSFGGRPLSNVIPMIWQLFLGLAPVVLGFWVVQKKFQVKSKLNRFGFLFTLSFGFLTLIRFLSNVNFWQDWIGYGLELQLGLVLLLPQCVALFKPQIRRSLVLALVVVCLLLDGLLIRNFFIVDTKTLAYRQRIVSQLGQISRGRIFVSGSPVFWLGAAKENLWQVRGGRDEVATHKTWNMGAYQIRQGERVDLVAAWLKIFGVSYLLTNNSDSYEYFHDFKNIDRFAGFTIVEKKFGNTLYKFDNSISRIAQEQILNDVPQSGNDATVIRTYAQAFGEPVTLKFITPSKAQILLPRQVNDDEVISLSVTYDPGWQTVNDLGEIREDAFGNMSVRPRAAVEQAELEYKEGWWGSALGLGLSLLGFLALFKIEAISHFLRRRTPSLSISAADEETEY